MCQMLKGSQKVYRESWGKFRLVWSQKTDDNLFKPLQIETEGRLGGVQGCDILGSMQKMGVRYIGETGRHFCQQA